MWAPTTVFVRVIFKRNIYLPFRCLKKRPSTIVWLSQLSLTRNLPLLHHSFLFCRGFLQLCSLCHDIMRWARFPRIFSFFASSRYWITVSKLFFNHWHAQVELTAEHTQSQAEPTLVRLPANVGVVWTTLGMHAHLTTLCASGASGLRARGGHLWFQQLATTVAADTRAKYGVGIYICTGWLSSHTDQLLRVKKRFLHPLLSFLWEDVAETCTCVP